jgi:hypothetical protein
MTTTLAMTMFAVVLPVIHVVVQTGEFAQGYSNAMGLVVAVFLAVSFFMLISWLTRRRH